MASYTLPTDPVQAQAVADYIFAQAAQEAVFAPIRNILRINLIYYVACFSILLWDWLILLPRERKLIWKANWSPVKVLYLWVRYTSLVTILFVVVVYSISWESPERYDVCRKINHLEPGLCAIATLGAELILAIRAWSVWNHSRRVLIGLALVLLAEIITFILGSIKVQSAPVIPGTLGCVAAAIDGQSGYVIAYFSVPAFADAIYLALIVIRSYQIRKQTGSQLPILSFIVRQGVGYFAIILVIAALCAAFFAQTANPTIQPINSALAIVIPCVLTCRMVLELRAASPEELSTPGRSSIWSKTTNGASKGTTSRSTVKVSTPMSLPSYPHAIELNDRKSEKSSHTILSTNNDALSTTGEYLVEHPYGQV